MSVTKFDWAALYEKFAPQNKSALSYAAAVIDEFRKNVGRIAMSLKSAEEQRWLENWAGSLTV